MSGRPLTELSLIELCAERTSTQSLQARAHRIADIPRRIHDLKFAKDRLEAIAAEINRRKPADETQPIKVGVRVMHDETGKEGVIAVTPDNTATRVMVLFDGADHPVPVYPGALEFVEKAA